MKSVLDKDKKEDDTNEFVSAVCWRAMPDGVSVRTVCQSDQWGFMSDILFICLRYGYDSRNGCRQTFLTTNASLVTLIMVPV